MEGCDYLNVGGAHVRSASRGGVPDGSASREPLATESSKLVGQPRISHRRVDGATQARSVSCNDVTYMRWMHNSWGMILAKIWNHSHWCYNG